MDHSKVAAVPLRILSCVILIVDPFDPCLTFSFRLLLFSLQNSFSNSRLARDVSIVCLTCQPRTSAAKNGVSKKA